MPAELVAQRGDDAHRKRVLLARCEAPEERVGDDVRRHAALHRIQDRPAALSGVVDVTAKRLQLWAFRERALTQLEQPRPHHAAVIPQRRHLMEVYAELRGLDQIEAFRICLQHPVLDAVVHHLDEVPGPRRTHVRVAILRRQRLESGLHLLAPLARTARHQAEPDLEAPDAAGRADIEELDAALAQLLRPAHGILVVAISAIDEDVARAGEAGELAQRPVRRLTGGDHPPHDAGRGAAFWPPGGGAPPRPSPPSPIFTTAPPAAARASSSSRAACARAAIPDRRAPALS